MKSCLWEFVSEQIPVVCVQWWVYFLRGSTEYAHLEQKEVIYWNYKFNDLAYIGINIILKYLNITTLSLIINGSVYQKNTSL